METPEEIKSDDNFLCGMELGEYNLSVYLTNNGSDKPRYRCFQGDELLFDGTDYKPAPAYGIDTLEAVIDLLEWLTLKPGDVDRDYFKNYTPAQIAWTKSDECYSLNNRLMDLQADNPEAIEEAKNYFSSLFIQP